ncbi:MAG: YraN family protein [Clostridia bacterium]|nr:YraN family protein [Clostridia bacterium]
MNDTKAKVKFGRQGEDLACAYLEALGYTVLSRNYKVRGGEVDIILSHGNCVVFAEVKTRHGANCGNAAEAVDSKKIQRLCTAAERYLYEKAEDLAVKDRSVRFDVVEVYINSQETQINHIKSIDIN